MANHNFSKATSFDKYFRKAMELYVSSEVLINKLALSFNHCWGSFLEKAFKETTLAIMVYKYIACISQIQGRKEMSNWGRNRISVLLLNGASSCISVYKYSKCTEEFQPLAFEEEGWQIYFCRQVFLAVWIYLHQQKTTQSEDNRKRTNFQGRKSLNLNQSMGKKKKKVNHRKWRE